jgi:hypothetical protein
MLLSCRTHVGLVRVVKREIAHGMSVGGICGGIEKNILCQ